MNEKEKIIQLTILESELEIDLVKRSNCEIPNYEIWNLEPEYEEGIIFFCNFEL